MYVYNLHLPFAHCQSITYSVCLQSSYVWLPLLPSDGGFQIQYRESWRPADFVPTYSPPAAPRRRKLHAPRRSTNHL